MPSSSSTPNSKTMSSSLTSHSKNSITVLMADELHPAIFESGSLLAKHLPIGDHVVKSIIDDLRTLHQVDHSKLQYPSDEGMQPWPAPDDSESTHYKPFTWLLNAILDLSRKKFDKSFHARLKFFHYDRNLQEGADDDSPLKPGLLGCHRESLGKDENVSWKDVEIAVEIKNRWPSIVSQATAYARCCFVFQESRKYITEILFNHSKMEVRIGFYSRSGLVVTEGFLLSSSQGFEKFVRAISGIYARTDAASAGIDESRTNGLIRVHNGDVYSITKVLCNRRRVRGRATRVYRIEKYKDSQISDTSSQKISEHANSSRTDRDPLQSCQLPQEQPQSDGPIEDIERLSLGKNENAPASTDAYDYGLHEDPVFDYDKDIPRNDFEIPSHNPMIYHVGNEVDLRDTVVPETCIIKQAWPLESQTDEGKMFKLLDGKFGLPRVVCSYEVANGRDRSGRTSEIVPADAKYWAVFSQEKRFAAEDQPTEDSKQLETITPEVRIHKCIIFDTKGISLLDAEGPRQLVEGIVHAMIGHYILFKHGWLHRDVSIGNVMLMKKETREVVKDFEVTRGLTECIGFIGDGDLAIEWRNNERELASHFTGTLPFVSMELAFALDIGKPKVHTPIDDLESFIWVLFWAILVILEARDELTHPRERWFLMILRFEDVRRLYARRRFLEILKEQENDDLKSSLAPFRRLLIGFLGIANKASEELVEFSELERICSGVYEEYIVMGVECLLGLASDWDNHGAAEDVS